MKHFITAIMSLGLAIGPLCGQTPVADGSLDLPHAESLAVANQPKMLAAQLRAKSIAERVKRAHSGYLPMVNFNATGSQVADSNSAIAAGALATSALSGRFSYGGNLTQLVTDFGRTSALVNAAHYDAEAQADLATLTRAQVRLNVQSSYYRVLGAEAVLRAAEAALVNRQ
jgi:outer membrane protein